MSGGDGSDQREAKVFPHLPEGDGLSFSFLYQRLFVVRVKVELSQLRIDYNSGLAKNSQYFYDQSCLKTSLTNVQSEAESSHLSPNEFYLMGFVAVHAQFGVAGQDNFDGGTQQPRTDLLQVVEAKLPGE